MAKKQDRDTRYFIDVNMETMQILQWDYDQKQYLVTCKPPSPEIHRVFLTLGQYNKFVDAVR